MFDMGNFGVFDGFQLDSQNLTYQIFVHQKHCSIYSCMVKDGDHLGPSVYEVFEELVSIKIFTRQNFVLYSILSN